MKTIQINKRNYWINESKGTVTSSTKRQEIISQGGGGTIQNGYGSIAQSRIKTIVHDDIYLTEESSGKAKAFNIQGVNVLCQTGHNISIISAYPVDQGSGNFIAVINHSTLQTFYHEPSIWQISRAKKRGLLLPSVIIYAISCVFSLILSFDSFVRGAYEDVLWGSVYVFAYLLPIVMIPIGLWRLRMLNRNKQGLKAAVSQFQ